jgi:hypothetical protein
MPVKRIATYGRSVAIYRFSTVRSQFEVRLSLKHDAVIDSTLLGGETAMTGLQTARPCANDATHQDVSVTSIPRELCLILQRLT